MRTLFPQETEHEVKKEKKKERVLANLISISFSGGQQFYFNYGTLLAVNIGATSIQMSFITAIQNLGNSVLQGFFGKMSDRLGRRIILILGFLLSAISTIILSFLTSPVIFMVIVALFSIGSSMVFPAWNALLGDITVEKERTRVIGKISIIGTFVSSALLLILGFVISAFDITLLRQYRTMVFIGSFFLSIGVILVILLTETNKNMGKKPRISIFLPFKNRKFVTLVIATMIWWFVMSFLWPLSPFVTNSVNPTSGQVAVMSITFSMGIVIGQVISTKFADRIGRRFTIFLGFMSLSFVPLILAFAYRWHIIVIANVFGGLGNGLVNIPLASEILNLAPTEIKGTYSGTYNILSGTLTFLGSFLGGSVFHLLEQQIDFSFLLRNFLLIIAALRFLASIPMLVISKQETSSPSLKSRNS
ncbi:MAG: MFS transporter [Candidatus Heimdallarchaeaceae archaeon]